MHQAYRHLIIYRDIASDSILARLSEVTAAFSDGRRDDLVPAIYSAIHRLLDLATRYGFNRNLWQDYLAYLLATTETPFSLACEKRGARDGSVNHLAMHDFHLFREMFHYDFSPMEQALNIDCFSQITHYQALGKDSTHYNRSVSEKVRALSDQLAAAASDQAYFEIITDFYRDHGVGLLGLNRAFRLVRHDQQVSLEPVTNPSSVRLNDLIGITSQKQRLCDNTEAFLQGRPANNLLLHGDSGTGKSSCIKAILNEYADRGLRIIEVYRHQFPDLAQILAMVKNRNYRFIIYMDDLSFEEFETDYKYLKAIIEGGLEMTPDNVLIYATSNRRHLIRETWQDRTDQQSNDVFHSDTVEEKIALVSRFGVTIYFPRPSDQEYLDIVRGLAARYPDMIIPEEELLEKAKKWGQWHGRISGRRAHQFINDLRGQEDEAE